MHHHLFSEGHKVHAGGYKGSAERQGQAKSVFQLSQVWNRPGVKPLDENHVVVGAAAAVVVLQLFLFNRL